MALRLMQEATLGGIPGRGVATFVQPRGHALGEWSGMFEFDPQHSSAVLQLFNSGDLVEFEGLIGRERQKGKAFISRCDVAAHSVQFEGSGAPY